MRIPGLKTANRYVSWFRSRFSPGALVLGYHRVADTPRDPYSLCVTPDNFAEQLAVIRQVMDPVSLSDVVSGMRNGTTLRRAVAITFDDGYVDNLRSAAPLLEKYGVPATVFVVASKRGRGFWWDELARIIYSASELPDELALIIKGRQFHRSIQQSGTRGTRDRLIADLYRLLRPLPPQEREDSITQLGDWAGVPFDPEMSEPSTRTMLPDELVKLASSELLEVGSHSLTHPILSAIPSESVQVEVRRSKSQLEAIIGRPVSKFSYPDGAMSRAVQAEVMSAGYMCACSSQPGLAGSHSRLFGLPRIWPLNRNGEQFGRWIRMWAND